MCAMACSEGARDKRSGEGVEEEDVREKEKMKEGSRRQRRKPEAQCTWKWE